jgi:flagellar basal body-associated protein FliL
MTQQPYESTISPQETPKKSNTGLIILIVVLVLLLCCCASALILYFYVGDLLLEIWNNMIITTGWIGLSSI